MRKVVFERSGLQSTCLAFGTSRLHYLAARKRRAIINLALELGILHFDTAPAYGDTIAEIELGQALARVRDRVVIATKYGIPPNPAIAALPALAPPLRALRFVARKAGLWRRDHPAMSAEGLRRSVEQSLRRLRTDRIDILLLHEPNPGTLPDPERLLLELQALQHRGMIRHFGLAGDWDGILALGEQRKMLGQIVQTNESQWPPGEPPDITYGAISTGPQSFGRPSIDGGTAGQRVARALARRANGVVIVSTTSAEHLEHIARLEAAT